MAPSWARAWARTFAGSNHCLSPGEHFDFLYDQAGRRLFPRSPFNCTITRPKALAVFPCGATPRRVQSASDKKADKKGVMTPFFALFLHPRCPANPDATQELPDDPGLHQHGPEMDAAVASLHVPGVLRNTAT
jgi:hypothetical protein